MTRTAILNIHMISLQLSYFSWNAENSRYDLKIKMTRIIFFFYSSYDYNKLFKPVLESYVLFLNVYLTRKYKLILNIKEGYVFVSHVFKEERLVLILRPHINSLSYITILKLWKSNKYQNSAYEDVV